MIVDRSASVRACAAGTVEVIARQRAAEGMSLFLRMDLSEDRLLTTPHVYRLLSWGLRDRFGELRPTVERKQAAAACRTSASASSNRALSLVSLPTPEAAIARVAQRVSEGGHDVPTAVIRRRFHAGWRNFEQIYRDLADTWAVYDNSDYLPVLLDEGSRE